MLIWANYRPLNPARFSRGPYTAELVFSLVSLMFGASV